MSSKAVYTCDLCDVDDANCYGVRWEAGSPPKLRLVQPDRHLSHICPSCVVGVSEELAAINKAHGHG